MSHYKQLIDAFGEKNSGMKSHLLTVVDRLKLMFVNKKVSIFWFSSNKLARLACPTRLYYNQYPLCEFFASLIYAQKNKHESNCAIPKLVSNVRAVT